MNITIELILLSVLLFLAAVTAASEISIIAVSRIKLRKLALGGSKTAKIILNILEMPERFFGTILVANDIVDALIAVLVTAMIIRIVGGETKGAIIVSTLVASFLIIVSEVSAKTFATRYAERMSMLLARPIKFFIMALTPIVRMLEIITKFIVNLMGGRSEGKTSLVTEEEVRALIKIGEEEGIYKEKYRMLSKVFDFGEAVVRNVMTSKKDIVAIDIDEPFDKSLNKVLESGYSRLPVYKDNPDNIIGIVNMKDILNLLHNRELIVLQDIVYPATFVSDTKKITELLKEFQKGHTHIALALNDKGILEGLVTLEDLLEEIVGEIEDEFDVRVNPAAKKHL